MRLRLLMLLLLLLAGCSDDNREVAAPSNPPIQEKPVRNRVVITANGRELRQTNLNERIELMVKVASIANPNMTLSNVQKLRRQLKSAIPKMFVREVAFDEYAKREGVKVDDASIEKARKSLLSGLGGGTRSKYDNIRRKVGQYAGVLDETVRAFAGEIAVRQHILGKNPLVLPPNYVADQMARIKEYNAKMALTNVLVYARATNVWEKLKGGADFRQMARKFSEVRREAEDGGEWGNLGLQQLEPDEELIHWAQRLQPGEISPPIEGDNGLMILRMDSKKGEDYGLSRIYFRLPMFQEEVSEEELLKLKHQQHDREIWERESKAILKSVKVVDPKKKRLEKKKRAKLRKGGKKTAKEVLPSRSERVKKTKGAVASESKSGEEGLKKTDLGGGANNQEQEEKKEKGSKR